MEIIKEPGIYPRRIYVYRRFEEKLVPDEGILAYRDIKRLNDSPIRERFAVKDLMNLRRHLLKSSSALYGPAFAMDKIIRDGSNVKTERVFVYVTTEYDIRIPVEYVPREEFLTKDSSEFMIDQFRRPKYIKATGVFYPYYLVEPGERFYIPYTGSFAIALRKFRFRGLLLRLGKLLVPEGKSLEEYIRLLKNIRHGIDKIVIKPVPKTEVE